MNKKIIVGIIAILVFLAGVISFIVINSYNNNSTNQNINYDNQIINNENINIQNNNSTGENRKSLVLYFSATGNTTNIAQYIQEITNGDITQILPKDTYTSEDLNYSNNNCRAKNEQGDNNARPEISNTINIQEYDTIYLGYPIWWGDVPKIILTLLDTYDFSGKTVIPFCTSSSSGIIQSMNTLKSYNENINWIEGKRFNSQTSKDEVMSWINELNIN